MTIRETEKVITELGTRRTAILIRRLQEQNDKLHAQLGKIKAVTNEKTNQ